MPRHRETGVRNAEGERLRALREALGMSQREIAVEFDVTNAAISQWESGRKTVPGPVLRLMALYESELRERAPTKTESTPALRVPPSMGTKLETAGGLLLAMGLFGRAPRSSVAANIRKRVLEKYVAMASRSRGLTMKWAQLVWTVSPLLSAAERDALRPLYSPGPLMSQAQTTRVFVDELGIPPRQAFARWDAVPFASASLGQVHRATLHSGEEVAVKIQSPDAAARMQDDLAPLGLLESVALVFMRNQRPGVLHNEFRTRFLEECDYRLEAERQRWVGERFAGDPQIRVPAVVERWCSRRVMTSSYVDARNLDDFAARASQAARDRAGETLFRFHHTSLFVHGMLNADPNPGNYLFDAETVTFLDFGRMKKLTPEFQAFSRRVLRAVLERNEADVRSALIDIGYVKNPSGFEFGDVFRIAWSWAWPLLSDRPFTFTAETLRHGVKIYGRDRTRRDVDLHPDLAFFPQVVFGLSALLTSLGARVRCRDIAIPLLYEKGRTVPPPYSDLELRKYGFPPNEGAR